MPYLVFDLGGTTVRAAAYEPGADRLTGLRRADTRGRRALHDATGEQIRRHTWRQMRTMGDLVLPAAEPEAVCVAFPGPLDTEGNAFGAPTLCGERGETCIPVLRELREVWPHSRVAVLNDVAAAGYSYRRGAGDAFCIVTASSGIGHKLFIDGRVVTGPAGRGGEIGHLRVDWSDDAIACDCGGMGHLGAVASGRGALDAAQRAARRDPAGFCASALGAPCGSDPARLTNSLLVRAFADGDAWARERIRGAAHWLGRALAAIHLDSGVERFVMVGGFALALGEPYRAFLVEAAREAGWDTGQDWERMIEMGDPGREAGLLGAGRYLASMEGRCS